MTQKDSVRALMRISTAALILVTSFVATGCATPSPTECAGWRPVYIGEADVLTRETASAILAHNRQGQERGCW